MKCGLCGNPISDNVFLPAGIENGICGFCKKQIFDAYSHERRIEAELSEAAAIQHDIQKISDKGGEI